MRLEEQEIRNANIREIQNPKEPTPGKERMSDEELGNLLAAVGNHEAKAILLSAMREGIVYSSGDLTKLFRSIQGTYHGWRIRSQVPFGYCEKSLSPIGLVTREALNPDLSTYGYIKTEYGKEIGDALAGHLLSFSEQHSGISLINLYGNTNSTAEGRDIKTQEGVTEYKKRSPLTRYKILSYLTNANIPVRVIDIVEEFGEQNSAMLTQHLQTLSENCIISYKGMEIDKPFAFYHLRSDRPESPPGQYRSCPSPTNSIYTILQNNPSIFLSAEDVVRNLSQVNLKNNEDVDRYHINLASSILSHLTKLGYAEKSKFSKNIKSQILLTEEQESTIVELVGILDRFKTLDSDFLNEGRQKAYEIVNSPLRTSKLLAKAKESSPYASKTSSEELGRFLYSLLYTNPGSAVKNLRQQLEIHYDKKISGARIRHILNYLKNQGLLVITEEKGANYWSVAEKPAEDTTSPASTNEQTIFP